MHVAVRCVLICIRTQVGSSPNGVTRLRVNPAPERHHQIVHAAVHIYGTSVRPCIDVLRAAAWCRWERFEIALLAGPSNQPTQYFFMHHTPSEISNSPCP